jgi:alpha-tubulin suppressor-like RCC1 family protein
MTAHRSFSPIAPERFSTRRRFHPVETGLALVLLVALTACGEDRILDPRVDVVALSTAIVSNPVSNLGSVSSVGSAAFSSAADLTGTDAIVYVSLPPGSLPNGEQVTIRNRRSRASDVLVMLNGGFDPFAVGAVVGDTLDLEFRVAGSVTPVYASNVVPLRRGPVVVRTDPPPKKRDVPLNAVMLVVFSEPISVSALSGSSVQVLLGGVPVAGTLRFADSEQLALTFTPDEPLAAGTDYTILVTQAIQDLDGEALAEEFRVDFTTATTSATGVWSHVSAGSHHTCAVTTNGSLYCWGSNFSGALGTGSTSNTPFPTRVAGGLSFTQVSAGAGRSCGLTTGGATYCWGEYYDLGESPPRLIPTLVAGGPAFAQLSVGGGVVFGFVSAVATSGVAYCWGRTGCWGYPMLVSDTPYASTNGLIYAQVSAGGSHACGVTTDNRAYCWGNNFGGQFGDGTTHVVGPSPETAVAGDLKFAQVSAGGGHTCGVTMDNVAYCWGGGHGGSLGDGTTEQRLTPTPVAGNLRFAQVSAGGDHTCGITTDHVAYCWGTNRREYPAQGHLGDGTTEHRLTPTPVAGGLRFTQVSAGGDHTCGITTDGSLYCWGFNWSGQLGSQFGYGTGGSRLTPTPVEPPN